MDVTENLFKGEVREGSLTKRVEMQTAKIPSMFYLALAGAAVGISLGLGLTRNRHGALFVGQWVPTFLLLGIYNKLVKLEGSDQSEAPNIH
jgi:hypothetical protein